MTGEIGGPTPEAVAELGDQGPKVAEVSRARPLVAVVIGGIFLGVLTLQCVHAVLRVGDVYDASARLVADPPAKRRDAFTAYGPMLALRQLAPHVRDGHRFAVVVGRDVDPTLALQLAQFAYYPARRVDDPEEADMLVAIDVAPSARPTGFKPVATIGDAWLGRRSG